jgi:hypothetical protein
MQIKDRKELTDLIEGIIYPNNDVNKIEFKQKMIRMVKTNNIEPNNFLQTLLHVVGATYKDRGHKYKNSIISSAIGIYFNMAKVYKNEKYNISARFILDTWVKYGAIPETYNDLLLFVIKSNNPESSKSIYGPLYYGELVRDMGTKYKNVLKSLFSYNYDTLRNLNFVHIFFSILQNATIKDNDEELKSTIFYILNKKGTEINKILFYHMDGGNYDGTLAKIEDEYSEMIVKYAPAPTSIDIEDNIIDLTDE